MLILGMETSCDETAVALVEAKAGLPSEALAKAGRFIVHKNLVYSQIKIHRKYGGVVPEVAARNHVEKIIPLIEAALSTPSDSPFPRGRSNDLPSLERRGRGRLKVLPKIDVIAVTAGPGLVTSLMVGVETARALAYLWKKPLVAVNHLEGHIYANFLSEKICEFPILCLIVSGGHTELVLMKKHLNYKVIGATRDDAAGECFDKVGKMLGLPYPAGPEVAKLADKGNPRAIAFPRPMMNSGDFSAKGGPASGWDFSFSGLKTAVLYYVKKIPKQVRDDKKTIVDICASFQQAAVDVLVTKTIRAAQKYRVKTIMLGGGVAANQQLRKQLNEAIKKQSPNTNYLILNTQFCSDNAAMIAAAGYFRALKKDFTPWPKLTVNPNQELV